MVDQYQNQGGDDDKSRKKHALMNDLIMIDSDIKKKLREKDALEGEMRIIKKEMERVAMDLDQKDKDLKRIEDVLRQFEDDKKRMQRKLNEIS